MKTIAWDVDDVLNNLMFDWFTKHWKNNNPSDVEYKDLIQNPPHQVLNITKDSYLASLDEFRSYKYYQSLKPGKDISDWFDKYGSRARHIVITAVPYTKVDLSAAWVLKHLGKWIRSFNYVPSFRRNFEIPVYDNSKKEFLSWFNKVDILVEDNAKNCVDAESIGINTFLVNQPWNDSRMNIQEVLDNLTSIICKD